jgi:SanA protein
MNFKNWLVKLILTGIISLAMFVVISNIWMIAATYPRVYEEVSLLPHKRLGLVLGTTHKLKTGDDNPYFTGRIKTVAKLYKEGKIDHILLSGDNRTKYYNEPAKMKEALLKENVPEEDITLDYAGLRTLDSIVRCKEIFGQNEVIIVTQRFHSYRALFISDYHNLDAVVMAAQKVRFPVSMRTSLREIIARPLAIIDLFILKRRPRLLGKKEYI